MTWTARFRERSGKERVVPVTAESIDDAMKLLRRQYDITGTVSLELVGA